MIRSSPSRRAVDAVPSAAELDIRTCFVLHLPTEPLVYLWVGSRANPAYLAAAQHWCSQISKFQGAPPPRVVICGSEGTTFWQHLGGKDQEAGKLAKYDSDYGVGTSPFWTPPELPTAALPARCCLSLHPLLLARSLVTLPDLTDFAQSHTHFNTTPPTEWTSRLERRSSKSLIISLRWESSHICPVVVAEV